MARGRNGRVPAEERRTPVFLEVNGRFWNSLALAIHAGVDFPGLVAELAQGKDVELKDRYRENVRCRWFLGDFRHLLEVMRGAPSGYPGKFPSRLGSLVQFLTPVRGRFTTIFRCAILCPSLRTGLILFSESFRPVSSGIPALPQEPEIMLGRGQYRER